MEIADVDVDATLYLDGNADRSFAAHCGPEHETYLLLGAGSTSTSTYSAGGCASVMSGQTAAATTSWTAVRFDPNSRFVKTGDYRFATSTGGTHDSATGFDYSHLPFGSGRSCVTTSSVVAVIDLTGTSFAVSAAQAWSFEGTSAHGADTPVGSRKLIKIVADGTPTGASPCAEAVDPKTLTGGNCLLLDYVK